MVTVLFYVGRNMKLMEKRRVTSKELQRHGKQIKPCDIDSFVVIRNKRCIVANYFCFNIKFGIHMYLGEIEEKFFFFFLFVYKWINCF